MAKRIYINDQWRFSENYEPDMVNADFDDSCMCPVRIPHTCKETPYNYFDEHCYQMISAYRRKIFVEEKLRGKRIILTFEGVAHDSVVFVNGEKAIEHHCGYTAFSVDISDLLRYGEDNLLVVKVDSRENLNVPPFGYVIDYMTYGGIYRDVYIEIRETDYLEDVFLYSDISWLDVPIIKLGSKITLRRTQKRLMIHQYIRMKSETNYRFLGEYQCPEEGRDLQMEFLAEDVQLWNIENPVLYEVKTILKQEEQVLDENITTFGFRKSEFLKDGFYLNNQKIKIIGLNRHQSYPYVGYAMPKSMQYRDADLLKEELGLNAVRTSHYPQSHYFLERCDEIGLLVFTEIPGWQHIGNDEWKAQAIENVRDMIKQYRNHPSIILWGVRINESKDDDDFYKKTNAVAHEMDPFRQTGGVRAHKKSSFLEDVYTYNDFLHDGRTNGCEPKKNVTPNMERAYLVSEYNGHMYPTKTFDCEEHRVEHAIRHANVLEAVAGQNDIAGSFGWCMSDYNTHKDFGSGDRICYHGVMDMFRNPKLAAVIYACQQQRKQILELSSTMDIGEHPGCNRGNTWIFTNADSVRMYKNGRFIKEYSKENSAFPNLSNGPILIDDFVGDAIIKSGKFRPKQAEEITEALNYVARYGLSNLPKRLYLIAAKMILWYHMKPIQAVELYNQYVGDWGSESTVYKFEAIKEGVVTETIVKAPMTKLQLWADVDHTELIEEYTYDVAAIRIRMHDEYGNLLHFYQEPVVLETEGPIEVIGEKIISVKGGMCGTYVRTTGQEGKAVLTIRAAQTKSVRMEFSIQVCKQEIKM